jgi:hypothetical protein
MSYERMSKRLDELRAGVKELLQNAEAVDKVGNTVGVSEATRFPWNSDLNRAA